MNKSKSLNKIYNYIFSLSLIYFIIVCVTYLVCFANPNFLYDLIIKFDGAKDLPFTLSNDDIKKISTELMNYLSEQSAFLETKVNINGVLTDFYSIRSKVHMGDVRQVFHTMLFSSYIAIAICLFTGFRIATNADENSLNVLKKTYLQTLLCVLIFIAVFFIFACINFDKFFTIFHQLLFTNDFWLLDPSEDYIICLLPEQLFMTYGLMIVVITVLCLGLLALLLHLLSKIQPRPKAI